MTAIPDPINITAKNAGAVWSAMAAYSLEADPRYAELERKLGTTAAKTIAITSAGNFWNADHAFSTDRLRAGDVPLDEYRANAVRLGIFQAVEGAARGAGLKADAISRIADSFYARLSSFERASLGAGPVAVNSQPDLTAAIARETLATQAANAATSSANPAAGSGTAPSVARFGDVVSGSRYDQLAAGAASGGTAYYGTPAGMAEMRQLAVAQGVAWVAGNPDLLRLGPEVIKAIAQTGMLQSNYRHLVEAGFKPAEVGSIARGVRELGLSKEDNRKLYEVIAEAFKGANTPEDQERRRRVSALFGEMGDHPERKREIARQISRVLDDVARAHPDAPHIKAVEQGKALLEKAADVNQQASAVHQRADSSTAAVDTTKKNSDDLWMAGLDGPTDKTADKPQDAAKPAPGSDPPKPSESDPKAKPKPDTPASPKKPTHNPTV